MASSVIHVLVNTNFSTCHLERNVNGVERSHEQADSSPPRADQNDQVEIVTKLVDYYEDDTH